MGEREGEEKQSRGCKFRILGLGTKVKVLHFNYLNITLSTYSLTSQNRTFIFCFTEFVDIYSDSL